MHFIEQAALMIGERRAEGGQPRRGNRLLGEQKDSKFERCKGWRHEFVVFAEAIANLTPVAIFGDVVVQRERVERTADGLLIDAEVFC